MRSQVDGTHIDGHNALIVLKRMVFECLSNIDACIAHKYINMTKLCDGGIYCIGDLLAVGTICLNRYCISACFLDFGHHCLGLLSCMRKGEQDCCTFAG